MDFDRHNLQPEDAGGMVDGDMDDTYIDHLNSAPDWSEREIARLKAENAKLREMVVALWKCCAWETGSEGWCEECDHHDTEEGGCRLESLARELGIEVD